MTRVFFWRAFANTATLLNALSGIWAIIYIIWGNKLFALALIYTGIGWDGLDGYASRRSGNSGTLFGRVADSVADSITFCVAPAFLVSVDLYPTTTWQPYTIVSIFLAVLVAALGLYRLVRYTMDTHNFPYFLGASTPQNAIAIAFLVLLFDVPGFLMVEPVAFLVAVAILAPLMVLPVKYPKMRDPVARRRFLYPLMTAGAVAIALPNLFPSAATNSWSYLTAFAFALVGFLVLMAFYVAGPWLVKDERQEVRAPGDPKSTRPT